MNYWIFDRIDTPQGFPLRGLIDKVLELLGNKVSFRIFSAWGHGEKIFELDHKTNEYEWVDIPPEILLPLSEGVEEWFYDLVMEIRNSEQSIICGIHDSSMMFIEGEAETVEIIILQYSNIEPYSRSKLESDVEKRGV